MGYRLPQVHCVRLDGKVVTTYYFATEEHPEQQIAATIWDPDEFD